MTNMPKINLDNVKKLVEDNPVLAATLAIALLSGTAKVMDANTRRVNAKTWKHEVDRRTRP